VTTAFSSASSFLQQAISLYKVGNRSQAYRLFAQAIVEDAGCDAAWLWISELVPTAEEKRYCLDMVIRTNPNNDAAYNGLSKLGPGSMRRPAIIASAINREPLDAYYVDEPVLDIALQQPQPAVSVQSIAPNGQSMPDDAERVSVAALRLSRAERIRLIKLLAESLAE
jgi:hypothetical protein